MGSVDELGVWTNPDPLPGRNHACSLDRCLHFVFPSVTFVKKEGMDKLLFKEATRSESRAEENGGGVRMVLFINSD